VISLSVEMTLRGALAAGKGRNQGIKVTGPTLPFAPPCDVLCIGVKVSMRNNWPGLNSEEAQREEKHAKAFLSSHAK
jgi:hypothetical protein